MRLGDLDSLANKFSGRDFLSANLRRIVEAEPTIDAVPVVRCDECVWYKPPHFAADDGTEHPWDGMVRLDARSDGIHVGGKCKHERNTAYREKDMAFRKPDDFCSYGERRGGE